MAMASKGSRNRKIRRTAGMLFWDHTWGGKTDLDSLAEGVARELKHPEWLDDSGHDLWDIVAEVAEVIVKELAE